jgi:hypothetical protein
MTKLIPVRTVRFHDPIDMPGIRTEYTVTSDDRRIVEIHPSMHWVRVKSSATRGGPKVACWFHASSIKRLDAPELDALIDCDPDASPPGISSRAARRGSTAAE